VCVGKRHVLWRSTRALQDCGLVDLTGPSNVRATLTQLGHERADAMFPLLAQQVKADPGAPAPLNYLYACSSTRPPKASGQTKDAAEDVITAAAVLDRTVWGDDDPNEDALWVSVPSSLLLNLRRALNYLELVRESERLGVPGPDVVDHPEDYNGACFCQECLANAL